MAYSISIPFFSVKLHFQSGGTIMTPLMDTQLLALNEPSAQIANRFQDLFQEKELNKGEYLKLMDYVNEEDFYKASLTIHFDAAKDGFSYPKFDLEFDYFFKKAGNGFWAIVPSLGVETFIEEGVEVELSLENAIRVDFVRKRRLHSVQNIISSIWFKRAELLQKEIKLKLPGLNELENFHDEIKEKLLPKVAKLLVVENQITFGRKAELEQFSRALKTKFSRNVILTGPSGVGKTALVWELARQQKGRRIRGQIWETTASTLIKELTVDSGWEDNMARLCKELSTSEDILFVRNFLELFEVGKYIGNEVSMADFIRPFISRGEISVITECTDEEFSRIQLKSPNYTSYFQIIKLEEPQADLENIIVSKVKSIAGRRKISIDKEAIKETIRLNRRFTPYAGFPGKPIRFLESILLNQKAGNIKIKGNQVISSFCEETGIPQFMIDAEIPMDVEKIKKLFNSNVFGQEVAVERISNLFASIKTALTRVGKPIASLLFVGPTGVGKTEMAKVLAEFMFGGRDKMLRFDMSEFSDPWSVLRLTGESYFRDGLLTSAVRREPFSVLLFDEIEKAHQNFYDLLLQILGEGRLTDSSGKLVNFCSTIIIMTSNIGAGSLQNNRIGWTQNDDFQGIGEHFLNAARKHFRPELFNRIDQIIPFEPLTLKVVRSVVEREIRLLKNREGIKFRKMDLIFKDGVMDYLAEQGYNVKYGARNLQRYIREELIIPLAHQLNLIEFDDQLIIEVFIKNNKLAMKVDADPLGLELLFEELDKINYTDHSSDLRRQLSRLMDGPYFIKMLSEVDILELEKKKLGEQFWMDKNKAKSYSEKLQFIERIKVLGNEIENYENDLSLACLDLKAYNPGIIDRLKDWEEQLFKYKIDLLAHENPEINQCYFSIYGTGLQKFIKFYLDIFKAKGYELDAKTVWFKEQNVKKRINKSEKFIKKNWNCKNLIINPSVDESVLYGIEMKLTGTCALLFLEEEKGIHHWEMSVAEDHVFVVEINEKTIPTPDRINRKEFYKGSPRRVFKPGHFKDNRLKINKEVAKNQFSDLVLQLLNSRFKEHLNRELL
jgi:MoxR-like ATPase